MLKKIARIQINPYEDLKTKKDITESLENAGYTVILESMTLSDECYIISLDTAELSYAANTVMFRSLNIGDIFSYDHEVYIRVDINENILNVEPVNAINLLTGSQAHIDLDIMVSKIKNKYKL